MISVVIPLYNKERSIKATLQSVIEQTYTDWELIVVDDGSTDGSADAVQAFIRAVKSKELKVKSIRLIHQENAGVSAARNRGIMEAKGEYVAFLDGDDLWAPNYLETLSSLIEDYPDAGLYSLGYIEVCGDNMPENRIIIEGHHRGRVEHPWRMQKGVWTGSVAAAKERLVKLGMFDARMTHGEDLDMWWRLIFDGGLVEDSTCCAYYRQDSENRAMNKLIPLEKHIPYYIEKYADARAKDAEFRRFFDEQMVYRLYPYLFDVTYKKEARRLANMLDYSLLKRSMRIRMLFPRMYRVFTKR